MSEGRNSGWMSRQTGARPGAKAARPPQSRGGRALAVTAHFARQRPGVILGVVAVLGCGTAIGWNALNQANRHPAPLFGPKAAARVEPPRRAEAPPAPVTAPLPGRRPEPAALVSPASLPSPPLTEAPARPAVAGDPIGAMIRASDPSPRPSAEPRPDARLSTAQKALTKIGYGPLKPDGLMGTTTRQALERFERDHNLPVTGGLAARTSRQLASVSGTPIE